MEGVKIRDIRNGAPADGAVPAVRHTHETELTELDSVKPTVSLDGVRRTVAASGYPPAVFLHGLF